MTETRRNVAQTCCTQQTHQTVAQGGQGLRRLHHLRSAAGEGSLEGSQVIVEYTISGSGRSSQL